MRDPLLPRRRGIDCEMTYFFPSSPFTDHIPDTRSRMLQHCEVPKCKCEAMIDRHSPPLLTHVCDDFREVAGWRDCRLRSSPVPISVPYHREGSGSEEMPFRGPTSAVRTVGMVRPPLPVRSQQQPAHRTLPSQWVRLLSALHLAGGRPPFPCTHLTSPPHP